jgi:hypothetical protein
MSTRAKRRRGDASVQPDPKQPPELGYAAHVRAAIEEGRAQIAAGQCVPAERAWKQLGIE